MWLLPVLYLRFLPLLYLLYSRNKIILFSIKLPSSCLAQYVMIFFDHRNYSRNTIEELQHVCHKNLGHAVVLTGQGMHIQKNCTATEGLFTVVPPSKQSWRQYSLMAQKKTGFAALNGYLSSTHCDCYRSCRAFRRSFFFLTTGFVTIINIKGRIGILF